MIRTEPFFGTEANQYKEHLANLRIRIFREFPYLYDGSFEHEEEYLETFLRSPDTIIVIAFDGETVVGASTGMPLENEVPELQKPWIDHGDDVSKVFYLSESVLLTEYRGQGIGVQFFIEREAWAKKLGRFELLAFCAVIRDEDHPQRPQKYLPLEGFWKKRGFKKREGYLGHLSWKEVGAKEESEKALQFWYKKI